MALARSQQIKLGAALDTTRLAVPPSAVDLGALSVELGSQAALQTYVGALRSALMEAEVIAARCRHRAEMSRRIVKGDPEILWANSGERYEAVGAGNQVWGWSAGGPIWANDKSFPREKLPDLDKRLPLRGRKVTVKGPSTADWLFVDSWWILGPLQSQNPADRERNLDMKFPPEAAVDLDTSYAASDGKALSWWYCRAAALPVVPPQPRDASIYYAWTEIHSDAEREVTMLMGADDYGKLWLNGKHVWSSGKTPHPWIPDRGVLKVKLNQGVNRLLFKLENAWGRTGFSVVVGLPEK
jgi:hypothetical protein